MEKFRFAHQLNDSAYRPLQVQSDMDVVLLPRFVITWQDTETGHQQSLGDLSTEHDDSPPCFLVLSMNAEHELMLHIHLPLQINDTPKGMRNTYMIASAESFNTDSHIASTDVLPIVYGPREHPALCTTGVEVGAKLLWVRFLFKEPGYVLMPVGKAQKPVNERSRGLLLSLKSLSQADSFELYVRDLGPNADFLRSFLRTLCLDTVRGPEVNCKSTFNGRPWGTNAWKSYKLRDDETLPGIWNPIFDERPPSYEEIVQSAPSQAEKALNPSSEERIDDSGEGSSGPHVLAGREHSENGNKELNDALEHRLEDNSEHGGSQETAVLESNLQSGREVREVSDETIILEDQHESSAQAEQEVQELQQNRVRKRNAHEARLDTAPSSSNSDFNATPGRLSERMTRMRKRVAFTIYDDEEARSTASFEDEPVRIIKETAVYHTASVLANGPNRSLFDDAQFRWFCDAVLWLATVWRRNHSVHDVYLGEFRMLCRFIRKKDRPAFETTRLRCMAMFVQKERAGQDEGPFACALKERARWMIDFIYQEFGPGHDTVVVDELTSLHESAQYWMQVGGDGGLTSQDSAEEYIRRENGFYIQMAACLLVACYLWERYEDNTVQRGERRVSQAGPA